MEVVQLGDGYGWRVSIGGKDYVSVFVCATPELAEQDYMAWANGAGARKVMMAIAKNMRESV